MPSSHVPVSREKHAGLQWRRFKDYGFARTVQAVDIGLLETHKVCMAMPILFRNAGDAFAPIALMGVEKGRSDFVGPDGRWLAGYAPAVLRGHPFVIAPGAEGQFVLCVDPDSTAKSGGEAFFEPDGSPSASVKSIIEFLQQIELSRHAARAAGAHLARLELLKPHPLRDPANPSSTRIEGLFSVDETALNALPESDFAGLRASGALKLAYHQMLSLELWPSLAALSVRQRSHREELAKTAAAIYRPADDGDLQIDWSQFKASSPP